MFARPARIITILSALLALVSIRLGYLEGERADANKRTALLVALATSQCREQILLERIERIIQSINRQAPAAEIARAVHAADQQYGVDMALLLAVIWTESDFRPHVIGDRGKSYGLMQIRIDYWGGGPELLEIDTNIARGAAILAAHIQRQPSLAEALQAYNGWGGDGRYVRKVKARYEMLKMVLS